MSLGLSQSTTVPSTGLYVQTVTRKGVSNYRRITFSLASPNPMPTLSPYSPSPPPSSPSPQFFSTGIGGAGNIRHKSERAIFFFDEELEKEKVIRENRAPVYSIGRGGAGNIISTESLPKTGSNGVSVDSMLSVSSIQPETVVDGPEEGKAVLKSGADRAWNRVRGFLGRRLL
ncbi:hypothetical protein C7212DRAFT_283333 [Tuber magnatum]|uniref:Uncharacterized protein n=1 Tax=Tuber magnatum TaxID=42249 RepID=A0A317SJZ6_9PEZI|nr:hypothetical protein C7212DRAFT_283333 [Tuber magnatum]